MVLELLAMVDALLGGHRRRRRRLPVPVGAVEDHLVLRILRACDEPHAVVVRVAVHSWAILVHGLHEAGLLDRASAAGVGGFGRRGAAVLHRLVVRRGDAVRERVAPIVGGQLRTGTVATHNLALVRVNHLQVRLLRVEELARGALVQRQGRAVYTGHHAPVAVSCVALPAALQGHLELERQGPPVDQADVDPVDALVSPECALKLGVDRRGAVRAILPRAPALADEATVALIVAPHLGPVAGGGKPVVGVEVAVLPGPQLRILWVGAVLCSRHVGHPQRFLAASICDAQPLRRRRRRRRGGDQDRGGATHARGGTHAAGRRWAAGGE
mmetsp:Transcript_97182/g.256563  ORF Transcript_97182/g.256563 Transcript_97182/m.256563 type:complete len:328 (-) Transcript_97182:39-1022(-)